MLLHANNYHLLKYQQTKDGSAIDSCFAFIGWYIQLIVEDELLAACCVIFVSAQFVLL